MEQVTCYKTDDGKIFETAAEVEDYLATKDFILWYEEHVIKAKRGADFSYVTGHSLSDWLKDNAVTIVNYLIDCGALKDYILVKSD